MAKHLDRILLEHGSGGLLSNELVAETFIPLLKNRWLAELGDGAVFEIGGTRLCFSTDTFVVHPRFFPGGDIGSLAVHGTVNDLAMCGGTPLYLSAGFVLEEGFPLEELERIVRSMAEAAQRAGVVVATGDTDCLFINTSGLGVVPEGRSVAMERAAPGDAVLVSGPIGDHGVAILSERQGLSFETPVSSDVAPLAGLVAAVLDAGGEAVHALRDPTRGGLGMVVCEVAEACRHDIELDEAKIPVRPEVRGACDLLGLDPLYVANEGKVVVVCAEAAASAVLTAMRAHPLGRSAARIGRVLDGARGRVTLRTSIGGRRVVDPPYGEQLPRIC